MQLSAPQSNHKDRQCTRLNAFKRGLNRVVKLMLVHDSWPWKEPGSLNPEYPFVQSPGLLLRHLLDLLRTLSLARFLHLLTQRSGKVDLIHMEPAGFGC